MSALDALFGQVFIDGAETELMGGLDFKPPLTVTPNTSTKRLELGVDPDAIGGSAAPPAFGMLTSLAATPITVHTGTSLQPFQFTGPALYTGSPLFAVVGGGAAGDCRLVYSGADACLALVRCVVTMAVPFESGDHQLGIAVDGDIEGFEIGQEDLPTLGVQTVDSANIAGTPRYVVVTERVYNLVTGTQFGPVSGATGGGSPGSDTPSAGFSMSVQIVG